MSTRPPPAIEGVATGTAGFAGQTRYGPAPTDDPVERAAPPRLVTSFGEFERVFGGVDC